MPMFVNGDKFQDVMGVPFRARLSSERFEQSLDKGYNQTDIQRQGIPVVLCLMYLSSFQECSMTFSDRV